MDCSGFREDVPAYQSGNLTPERAEDVGHHLATCTSCMSDARDAQSAIALLKAIDVVDPSPDVWVRLRNLTSNERATRRASSLRPILKFAAAASVLVAALSFIFVATVPRASHAATVALVAPDGADLKPGTRIAAGDTFRAPTYVVLTLPDIGLLKLNRDTEVRFDSANRVHVLAGELFAEVSRGFVVESADARVTVRGTRFGLRTGAASTVYVVEGSVVLAAGRRTMELGAGRKATVGHEPAALDDDTLGWMARHERVLLTCEPRERTMRMGDAPTWEVAFRTSSAAPLFLEPPRELPQQLFLKVTDPQGKEYSVPLRESVTPGEIRAAVSGLTRLDVFTPACLKVRAAPSLFQAAGRYTVTLEYQGRHGALRTDPFTLEVQ